MPSYMCAAKAKNNLCPGTDPGADTGGFLRGVRFKHITVLTLRIRANRSEQTVQYRSDQTPQNAVFDQILHCLPLTQQFHTHLQAVKWTN